MSILFKNYLLALAMLLSIAPATVMKPTDKIADHQEKIDLETMIPKNFGGWKEIDNEIPLILSPERKELITKLYNQTLSRTYIDTENRQVMLSIAYGSQQSDNLQVHKPEVCYAAQGFEILKQKDDLLRIKGHDIFTKQVVAKQGDRIEPITYWIRIGDQTISGSLARKLAQLKYTLKGSVPDGLVFRVSSIQADEKSAYDSQKKFVNDLFDVLDPDSQIRLMGNYEQIEVTH